MSDKKYIEIGEAIWRIKEYTKNVYGINLDNSEEFAGNSKRENYCEGLYEATEIINDVPAADVKEVKHGYWVNAYPEIEPNPMFMYGICSECGAETGYQTKYCHECGSVMDLKVEVTGQEKVDLFKKHGKFIGVKNV